MGDKQNQPFQLSFNASLKVDFQGSRVTSDGGLILVRELDQRLGFGELIDRRGKLEDGAPGGGQGGVPPGRTLSSRGIHRDQPGDRQPGGGAVLQ